MSSPLFVRLEFMRVSQQLAQQQQAQQGGTGTGATGGSAPGPGGLDLDALRNSPQIRQLREQMMQNPENVQLLVQQLAAQNPQIAQALGQNPQALMELLGIEISDDVDMEGQPIPPGAQVVSVTPEERAAIERVGSFVVCGWLKLKWNTCS